MDVMPTMDQQTSLGGARLVPRPADWLKGPLSENPQASYYRARYYDASVGRFVAEDPVGFDADPNFYRYVRNNPTIFIDPTGLQIPGMADGTLPPDPRTNTIVCDGHGHIRVQIGFPETLGDGSPKAIQCLIGCARVHEQSHLGDALAANPKVCKGQAKGRIVASEPPAVRASEVRADDAELDCLRNELDHGCKGCGAIILDRITEVESHRAFNKKPN
jgi:RHS repeat-associated protein